MVRLYLKYITLIMYIFIRLKFFKLQTKFIKNSYFVLSFTIFKRLQKLNVPIIAADEKSGKGVDGDDMLLCSIRC